MRYRKKPVEVESIQWTGENIHEIERFAMGSLSIQYLDEPPTIHINTIEGLLKASVGDYIIKGIKGEFYPCKPDIFEQTYEPV